MGLETLKKLLSAEHLENKYFEDWNKTVYENYFLIERLETYVLTSSKATVCNQGGSIVLQYWNTTQPAPW